ncbi:flagellar protein [Bacillus sp. HMF5848]|uniref:TIGR02530 family flagellar biosynthesis protein n=1 Tax=Bacillus sp. HMF5848 TaxID=2495421 RepID=UPI000F79F786|nr:TIGR02530 family flagellar biosynthesis protein [Bacillus sp. HMF5848]RSK27033.1 flagellar protein [Bacillus sp. HMF5848]
MDHRLQQISSHPLTLQPKTRQQKQPIYKQSFQDVFQKQLQCDQLKVSKHAEQRLIERNIKIDMNKWNQINDRVAEARQKGIQDSLVVLDGAALIVNAKNNTVITAMNREEAKSQIFTNINGTILID